MCTVWRMLPVRQHSPRSAHILLAQATFSTQCTHPACSSNILHTVHKSCLLKQHSPHSAHILLAQATFSTQYTHLANRLSSITTAHNRTDNYRQWNAVGSPDDGHKDAWNILRHCWLPINHYLLHLVGLTFTYLSKMHGHSNIKIINNCIAKRCFYIASLSNDMFRPLYRPSSRHYRATNSLWHHRQPVLPNSNIPSLTP